MSSEKRTYSYYTKTSKKRKLFSDILAGKSRYAKKSKTSQPAQLAGQNEEFHENPLTVVPSASTIPPPQDQLTGRSSSPNKRRKTPTGEVNIVISDGNISEYFKIF